MKKSNPSPLTGAVDAARKLHKDHNDFDRTAAAVRRAAYNLLDAMDALPATADFQAVVSELDAEDMRLLQSDGMDGGAAKDRLAQAAQREIDKLKKDIQYNPEDMDALERLAALDLDAAERADRGGDLPGSLAAQLRRTMERRMAAKGAC